MGNEANCTMTIGKQKSAGSALLETSEIIFRPADGSPRFKIPFVKIKSAKFAAGKLHLETPDGKISFDLGPAAEKWCDKILHPKTRIEKLGVKSGVSITVLGNFDAEFLKELRHTTTTISQNKLSPASELIFLRVSSKAELSAGLVKTAKALKGTTALWIIYPRGKKEITENDVLTAGRKTGLKDIKVVGFSPTHTALKFVVPVANR
jgi:hypothetical protein